MTAARSPCRSDCRDGRPAQRASDWSPGSRVGHLRAMAAPAEPKGDRGIRKRVLHGSARPPRALALHGSSVGRSCRRRPAVTRARRAHVEARLPRRPTVQGVHDLRREEWIAVAAVVAAIVVINKLVIRDQGNSWAGLIVVSFALGLGLVHLRRWLRRDQSNDTGRG
jgi:hypothetical protein